MSRIPVWCEIVCRTCSNSPTGEWTADRIPKRSLVANARKCGFIFKHDESFCSEKCLVIFEKEKSTPAGEVAATDEEGAEANAG